MNQQPYPEQPQAQYTPPTEQPYRPPQPDYHLATQPERPQREPPGIGRILIPIGTFILGVIVGALMMTSGGSSTSDSQAAGTQAGAVSVPAATSTPAARVALTSADIKLTIRETKKTCFGSAGCNVEFTLDAAVNNLAKTASGDSYEVTYAIKGLTDEQIGTLTLKDDGTFQQDSFQFGQKARSSTKLTATVTGVRKLL